MAHTLTLLDASLLQVRYLLSEDGTAAAEQDHDISGDLIDDGGRGILNQKIGSGASFADDAAAQLLADEDLDVSVYLKLLNPATGHAQPQITFTQDSNAFRVTITVAKDADATIADFILTIENRNQDEGSS
jgi:hypothetical protein